MIDLSVRIHAILFIAGEHGATLDQLQESLDQPKGVVQEALKTLQQDCQWNDQLPYEIAVFDGRYQLMTKTTFSDDVESYAQAPLTQKLSRSALETLAIVAYQQPITRAEIDDIRGVQSTTMLSNLSKRGLLQEVGRIDGPGRPFLYGTSSYFLEYFGLASLDELPALNPLELEEEIVTEQLFQYTPQEAQTPKEGN